MVSGTPIGGTWTGNGIAANSNKFIGATAGAGLHTIYYSYEDSNACKNLDSLVVNVWSLPQVNAGNDTILCNQPGVVDFDGNFTPGYWTGNNIDSVEVEQMGQVYMIFTHLRFKWLLQ